MKRIISLVLAVILLSCMAALPCAAESNFSVRMDAEYSADTKILTLSGNAGAGYARSITFYLLRPGKIQ